MVFRRFLSPLRRLAARFFYNFGLHCGKNQIRVILISDLVITSLFYPALALYFSSQPLSHFSIRLHDSLFSFASRTHHPSSTYGLDLLEIWEGLDAVRLREDAAAQARCGGERTILLERILVPSVVSDCSSGALNQETLSATLNLQLMISEVLGNRLSGGDAEKALECVRSPSSSKGLPDGFSSTTPECLTLGPLLYWNQDEVGVWLESDVQILDTINSMQNVTKAGVPILPEMTLAGRGSHDEHDRLNDADYLVLTYFFVERDCHSNAKHLAWQQIVNEASSDLGIVVHPTDRPKLIALQYSAEQPQFRSRMITVGIYICYFIIFVYFSGALRRIDTVHSRFGLAFTGLVEIVASTITSVSVCALWGFHVTMVPWAVLPVMIVFIGAEDMFILIQEVTSTPVSLPVRERIARGLSRGGTSNTFKVFAYNAIFGSMAYFATGAIKQFCIFTVVVLVAHWFLIHTFFVAVLAIDIQRLELADLLQQEPRLDPTAPKIADGDRSAKEAAVAEEVKSMRRFFRRDRAAKNGSLLVILAITGVLYYASLPNQSGTTADARRTTSTVDGNMSLTNLMTSTTTPQFTTAVDDDLLRASTIMVSHPEVEGTPKPAQGSIFWTTFNPTNDALLHIRIQSPSQITLRAPSSSSSSGEKEHDHQTTSSTPQRRRTSLLRTSRYLIWTLKIVIFPMSATALALYGLLAYLLKDAELLEAQRDRAEGDSPVSGTSDLKQEAAGPAALPPPPPVDAKITFTALPRAFLADVAHIAASDDKNVVVSISVANETVLWKRQEHPTTGQARTRVQMVSLAALLAGLPSSQGKEDLKPGMISALAVDAAGVRCALGTKTGLILQWSLMEGLKGRSSTQVEGAHPIASISFLPSRPTPEPEGVTMPGSASTIRPTMTTPKPVFSPASALVACLSDGRAYVWHLKSEEGSLRIPTSSTPCPVPPIMLAGDDSAPTMMFALADRTLDSQSIDTLGANNVPPGDFKRPPAIPAPEEITQMHVASLLVGTDVRKLAATVTDTGMVSVHDLVHGEILCSMEDAFENVTRVRLIPVPESRCEECGQMEPDSFLLAVSTGPSGIVQVFQAISRTGATRCWCVVKRLDSRRGSKDGLREAYHVQRSRTGSIISTSTSSPVASRVASFSSGGMTRSSTQQTTTSDYPISGHGYHSRRVSEKEPKGRQSTETNMSADTDYDPDFVLLDPFAASGGPSPSSRDGVPDAQADALRRSARVIKIAQVACDRGQWDVMGSLLIGVRRRARAQQSSTEVSTNTRDRASSEEALLGRWEVWTYSAKDGVRASPLPSLKTVITPPQEKPRESPADSELVRRYPAIQRIMNITTPEPPPASSAVSMSPSRSSSLTPMTADPQQPALPFTRVTVTVVNGSQLLVGLGNTAGIVDASHVTTASSSSSSPNPDSVTTPTPSRTPTSSTLLLDKKRF